VVVDSAGSGLAIAGAPEVRHVETASIKTKLAKARVRKMRAIVLGRRGEIVMRASILNLG
jgi:hypothetical protein